MRHAAQGFVEQLAMPEGCPVAVAAARVPAIRPGDVTRRYASGWGATVDEAAESCTLEVAERLSVQVFGDEPIRRAAWDDLGETAISPREIMLIGEEQYASLDSEAVHRPHAVEMPCRWHPGMALDWIQAAARLSTAVCWLPAGLCFLGHVADRAAGLLPADTNGVAAGASLEDAAVRAFIELAERDAVAIWWYNRLLRPRLDPADLGEALVTAFGHWSTQRGRPLTLYDLSHDCGVRVIAAMTHDAQGGRIALGFGAGGGTAEAARHAVGELAQFECNVALIERRVAARGDRELTPEALSLLRWWRNAVIGGHPHLGASAFHPPPNNVPHLEIDACHAVCARLGLPFLALNLTRPSIGTPIVRVIVPGLRSTQPRLALGRLYQVPVQLGWLARPRIVAELNATPFRS